MAIFPLFAGRAEFTRFILRRPEVLFRMYRDGTHSATQVLSRLGSEEKAVPAKGESVLVALKYLSIEEAKLQLILEEEDGRETQWRIDPFTLRLSGIGRRRNEFEVRTRIEGAVRGEIDFSGSASHDEGMVADPTFFHVSGKGKVFGQAVAVEGKISAPLGLAETDMTVTFPKINMAEIPAIFTEPSAALSQAAFEGVAKLTMKVSGNLQAMGVEAEADLTRAGWTISADPRPISARG